VASKDKIVMKTTRPIFATALLLAFPGIGSVPNSSEPPLPAIETVLKRVAEKSFKEDENERAFRERYAYTRTRVTEFRNANGEVKKREEKKGQNDPIRYRRALRARVVAAKPVRASDRKSNEPVSETHSNVRGKAFKKGDLVLTDDLISRFDFKVSGREVVNGRPALIVDFQPAEKNQPVRNLKDRFINKAAGRVWVDEADYALVKADLHLTERVNVLGGLVGAVWKFTFDFMRERTPDGFWFTRNSNWHLEGREVFVHRTVDYHEERIGLQRVLGEQSSLAVQSVDVNPTDD